MVTGRPPFLGATPEMILRRHLREEPTDPRERNLQLSVSAAAVILKMLAKEPDDRYGSLDGLAEDLQSVVDGRPARLAMSIAHRPEARIPLDLEEDTPRRFRRAAQQRRKALITSVVTIVALVAIGAGTVILNPLGWGTGAEPEERGRAAPVEVPEEPVVSDTEAEARQLYREAESYLKAHPAAPWVEKIERFRQVSERFPGSEWGQLAKAQVQELEREQERIARSRAERARASCETLIGTADDLAQLGRFGDALRELAKYPVEFADTEHAARIAGAAERLREDADTVKKRAIAEAESLTEDGDFEGARRALDDLTSIGLPEIEDLARDRIAEIRAKEREVREARAKGKEALWAAVCGAFDRAAAGEFERAAQDLARAEEQGALTYFRDELSEARENLVEAGRFAQALPDGAKKLVGRIERLSLIGGERHLAGEVLEVDEKGIRLARGSGEETVPFDSLAPHVRIRLAFHVLDEVSVEDHRAAALYLIIHGFMEAAAGEIEATRILGSDPAPLTKAKKRYAAHLRSRMDAELRMAEEHLSQGRLQKAHSVLAKLVTSAPWYGRSHLLLGAVLVELRNYDQGLSELDRAAELGSSDPSIHFFRGEALFGKGDHEEALRALGKYEELAPVQGPYHERARNRIEEIRSRTLRARIEEIAKEAREAYRRKRWAEAIGLYGEILELDPGRKDCHYFIGKAHLKLGEILRGYLVLRRYLSESGSSRYVSDTQRQLRRLEKAHRDNSKSAGLVEEGLVELARRNYSLARHLFDQAVTAGPLNAEAYFNRGLAQLQMEEESFREEGFRAALEDYIAAELLDPTETLIFEGKALCMCHLKDYEGALANAARAIEEHPDRWQSYNVAGLAHHALGKPGLALIKYTEGIARASDQATLYINRALALEALERYDEADEDLKSARSKNPTGAQIQQIRAIVKRMLKAKDRR
jgi:tetratricopeptide (TPR) repeat protein